MKGTCPFECESADVMAILLPAARGQLSFIHTHTARGQFSFLHTHTAHGQLSFLHTHTARGQLSFLHIYSTRPVVLSPHIQHTASCPFSTPIQQDWESEKVQATRNKSTDLEADHSRSLVRTAALSQKIGSRMVVMRLAPVSGVGREWWW